METPAPTNPLSHRPSQTTAADPTPAASPRPLRLIQLTDSHLFATANGRLLDLDTRRSFAAVLALALGREQAADALVMTGDLVHDESAAGYAYLAEALAAGGCPCLCLPGNHDRRELMERSFGAAAVAPVANRRFGGWHLIWLDSTQPGREGGRLTPRQFHHLDLQLQQETGPTLIFLHQHPIPVGSAWIDAMNLSNGAQLLAVCDRHRQVRALVCGHIHQEFAAHRGHYQVLGTPSTCLQFAPGSAEFALDCRTPGYRELRLHPDGRLDSWVERLAKYPEPLKLSATGY